jgi:hypothetical protein
VFIWLICEIVAEVVLSGLLIFANTACLRESADEYDSSHISSLDFYPLLSCQANVLFSLLYFSEYESGVRMFVFDVCFACSFQNFDAHLQETNKL